MSLVHTGPLSSTPSPLDRLATTIAQAFHRNRTPRADRTPTLGRVLEPAQMSRMKLADELLSPTPRFSANEISDAVSVGIAPAAGSAAQAMLARRLAVARELLCRDLRDQLQDAPIMATPEVLVEMLRLHCARLDHEVFLVVYLSTQHRVIAIEQLFRGTLTQTSVYPREVVKGALAHQAAAVALAHNHPQGDAEPSAADRVLTQRLQQALTLVDVRVIDHFIVAGPRHFSFAKQGLI